uniref:DNA-directed RNA polymerase n=1 Tax=Ditylenchus dipsaci TaxID=166011 RepID=A0A915DH86_9BILA
MIKDASRKGHNHAVALRKAMPQPISRKLLKQTVMTTVYGVTQYGAQEQIKRQLRAMDIVFENLFLGIWPGTPLQDLKKWFQGCAIHASKLHQTMQWETPLGLPQVNAFPPNFVHSLDSTHMMLTTLFCHKEGLTFAAVHDCFWTHACDVDKMNEICRDQFVALHEYPIIDNLSEFLIKTYVDELPISEEDKKMMSQRFIPHVVPGTLNIKDVRNSTYFFS